MADERGIDWDTLGVADISAARFSAEEEAGGEPRPALKFTRLLMDFARISGQAVLLKQQVEAGVITRAEAVQSLKALATKARGDMDTDTIEQWGEACTDQIRQEEEERAFKVGDRVVLTDRKHRPGKYTAGMAGVVERKDPDGDCWILLDNAPGVPCCCRPSKGDLTHATADPPIDAPYAEERAWECDDHRALREAMHGKPHPPIDAPYDDKQLTAEWVPSDKTAARGAAAAEYLSTITAAPQHTHTAAFWFADGRNPSMPDPGDGWKLDNYIPAGFHGATMVGATSDDGRGKGEMTIRRNINGKCEDLAIVHEGGRCWMADWEQQLCNDRPHVMWWKRWKRSVMRQPFKLAEQYTDSLSELRESCPSLRPLRGDWPDRRPSGGVKVRP